MKYIILSIFTFGLAFANENDLAHRPKSFSTANGKAVFVDFTNATYYITYDIAKKSAAVKADIDFMAPEAGLPIFDSVTAPTSVLLDGQAVSAIETKTPSNETTLRVVNKSVAVGNHKLSIALPLAALFEMNAENVKSAFWTSDLDEREFLERYMPANFEFDQVKMTFVVKFIGAKLRQVIYTNGVMENLDKETTKISYPSYYTASSIFFHTVPEGAVDELRFTIRSIDGRELPAVVYAQKSIFGGLGNLERIKTSTMSVIQELERDYGAFPHPTVTVYNAGMGGMEYCGATMTSASALGHELFHSYFARGVMPANGNSGWIDEALASWRDDGYQSLEVLSGSAGMSSHAYYTRTTDQAAYSFGERFMSFLDGKLQDKGGLKPFMRYMVDKKVFAPFFVEEFIQEMSNFYGVSMDEDFKKYTYGMGNKFNYPMNSRKSQIHRKMSLKELQNYL